MSEWNGKWEFKVLDLKWIWHIILKEERERELEGEREGENIYVLCNSWHFNLDVKHRIWIIFCVASNQLNSMKNINIQLFLRSKKNYAILNYLESHFNENYFNEGFLIEF